VAIYRQENGILKPVTFVRIVKETTPEPVECLINQPVINPNISLDGVDGRKIEVNSFFNVSPTSSLEEVKIVDADVICEVYHTTTVKRPGIILRAKGESGNETGYTFHYVTAREDIEIAKYFNGSFTTLGSKSFVHTENAWHKIRAYINESDLKIKFWLASDSEPADWDVEVTDTDIENGFIGVFDFESNDRISYFRNFNVTSYKDVDDNTGDINFALIFEDFSVDFGDANWNLVDFEDERVLRHRRAGSTNQRSAFTWKYK